MSVSFQLVDYDNSLHFDFFFFFYFLLIRIDCKLYTYLNLFLQEKAVVLFRWIWLLIARYFLSFSIIDTCSTSLVVVFMYLFNSRLIAELKFTGLKPPPFPIGISYLA